MYNEKCDWYHKNTVKDNWYAGHNIQGNICLALNTKIKDCYGCKSQFLAQTKKDNTD